MVEEARLAGLKVILSLADNWKYPGGVDEYVDRSETAPKRGVGQTRPPDQLGDADSSVRLSEESSNPSTNESLDTMPFPMAMTGGAQCVL